MLRIIKPSDKPDTNAEKAVGVTYDIITVTPDDLRAWRLPPCQRELSVNSKVRAMSVKIREGGGVIFEPISLARIDGHTYLVDGQHRREAALLSECEIMYVEIRWLHVRTLNEVAALFDRMQQKLVIMRPDDTLRARESSVAGMLRIRAACPFVGYDRIRRQGNGPMISMGMVLRAWFGAVSETPSPSNLNPDTLVESIKVNLQNDVNNCTDYITACYDAWGRESTNKRLWMGLNLTLCAWLYQRLVTGQYSGKTTKLTKEGFKHCLMSVAADPNYSAWLVDRTLRERDRAAAYTKLKQIFAKRITLDTGKKPMLTQPAWAPH